jgi:uncharacterized protein (DUF4415 family)
MANDENIKRYTREELRAMRERGEDLTDWAKIDAKTEEEIEAAIASDPDEAGIEWDWDKAALVMPEPKAHVNLRLDADVVRYFKSQGKGYQTRINAVLRSYVEAQQAKKSKELSS